MRGITPNILRGDNMSTYKPLRIYAENSLDKISDVLNLSRNNSRPKEHKEYKD